MCCVSIFICLKYFLISFWFLHWPVDFLVACCFTSMCWAGNGGARAGASVKWALLSGCYHPVKDWIWSHLAGGKALKSELKLTLLPLCSCIFPSPLNQDPTSQRWRVLIRGPLCSSQLQTVIQTVSNKLPIQTTETVSSLLRQSPHDARSLCSS